MDFDTTNPALALPTPGLLDALIDGDLQVQLWDVLPDCTIEVFLIRSQNPPEVIAKGNSNGFFRSVHLDCKFPLKPGDQVYARQFHEKKFSKNSQRVTVRLRNDSILRPFYFIGHNPNTIKDVKLALAAGANAIEPDINVYSHDPSELCFSHFEGSSDASTLIAYLEDLHQVVLENAQLALIIFDCKHAVTNAEQGYAILSAIRNHLTYDTGIHIILSIGKLDEISMFDNIKNILSAREGIMIDEENDPISVSNYFKDNEVVNACYANGISVPLKVIFGPNIRPSIEQACALRAQTGFLKFIGVWTINTEHLKREYIRIGVDGIISDDLEELNKLSKEKEFQSMIRVATRDDDPFNPANNSYSLAIYTADSLMAGTDANLTFILTGSEGSSKVTVNSAFRDRMERNHLNYVTIPSIDLGNLISITVQHDNVGYAPGWCLEKIVVTSKFFDGSKVAIFDTEIVGTEFQTRPF
jgi:hypothetical protein